MRLARLAMLAMPVALMVCRTAALAADDVESRCTAIAARVQVPKLAPGDGNACDAYSLYYGSPGRAGNPADPKAAFACASKDQSKVREKGPLDGSTMLATMYANGVGAPRDLDRAEAYVCRTDAADAEKEGMLDAIAQLRKAPTPGVSAPFRVCDHATSAVLGTACFERANYDKQNLDEDYFGDLAAKLTGTAGVAFAKLRDASQAFAATSSEEEVDTSGSGGPVFVLEAERREKDAFIELLRRVMGGQLPAGRPFAQANKDLNAAYGKLMKGKDKSVQGTVTKAGIRKAQKAWLAYRDRFVAFAAAAAPAASKDALTTTLTEQRTKQLVDLGS